jgi:GTP-binding protein
MKINSVQFIKSSAKLDQCPDTKLPEYAFVGRSNVGKSSLINCLTNRKKLALTSGNPGKTRLINHFLVNENWYLVDLPGYGYAKLSKKERIKFEHMIKDYLLNRTNMVCLFLLIDIRHEPIDADIEFLSWLGQNLIPFTIVFTKADKINHEQVQKNISNYKEFLLDSWESLPEIFATSSTNNLGNKELLNYIEDTNRLLKSN